MLRLIADISDTKKENPIINAEFKDEIILKRNIIREEIIEAPTVKAVEINIISEIVSENLPSIIERFKCCGCEKCIARMTVEALNHFPAQYVFPGENSEEEIDTIKQKYRPAVLSLLVRLAS